MTNVRELFGDIDIYLFDQILKERFSNSNISILDAGCGGGRNLLYFLRGGFQVFGIDQNPKLIEQVRNLAKMLAPNLPAENFQTATVDEIPFSNEFFEVVISSAVLHFAADREHFHKMLLEMWRVLKPEGLFFARLASSIGIENLISPIGNGRYLLPDGSTRFVVDEELLISMTSGLGGVLLEPLKTTNVQNLRCMTTWVLRKTKQTKENN
ncbi:MAG: class I SAM-dependent methyltransferase [Acidobacteria bacterium]|jgi:SAM-dependent methyltransferase|nr:class I SAM-dependent methyltransferase [Acidobacteriota bacterium]